MPRHPRLHAPGLLFHLLARGNNGQAIYLDTEDYTTFVKTLRVVRERYPFRLYAYVLMPNHFHLLVETMDTATSRVMQALLTRHARQFNARYGRRGHLFQGRYKAILCDRDSYLAELVRYIHLNPVRAGLAARPEDWLWSGHREYLGLAPLHLIDPGPVMEVLQTPARYAAFVRAGLRAAYRPDWHPGESAPFVGNEAFVARVRTAPPRQDAPRRPALGALCAAVANRAGLDPAALRVPGRTAHLVATRDALIQQAVLVYGYRPAEVAAWLGCHPSNVTRAVQKKGAHSSGFAR